MSPFAPWLVLAGLGAFHGLNPAMGWLFAVALGLHRNSRRTTVLSLLPIAAGHAASIAVVAGAVVLLGMIVDARLIEIGCGLVLIGWAVYHIGYGHRHRVRVGMTTGMAGLALWSFLMATAHGAGLMLVPVLIPLCLSGASAGMMPAMQSLPIAAAAVAVHMAAMLFVTLIVALAVYDWFGLAFLRRGWINVDRIWMGALIVTGLILIV